MYANYDPDTNELITFTDFDVYLTQFVIEKEMFGVLAQPLYIPFTELPQHLQAAWKPVLQEVFARSVVFYTANSDAKPLGICSFAISSNGTCNLGKTDEHDLIYNRFIYRRDAGTDDCVLIVKGVTMKDKESGLAFKRERVQIIDTILAYL